MSVRLDIRDTVLEWCQWRGRWVEIGARLIAADPDKRYRQDSISRETWARLCVPGLR